MAFSKGITFISLVILLLSVYCLSRPLDTLSSQLARPLHSDGSLQAKIASAALNNMSMFAPSEYMHPFRSLSDHTPGSSSSSIDGMMPASTGVDERNNWKIWTLTGGVIAFAVIVIVLLCCFAHRWCCCAEKISPPVTTPGQGPAAASIRPPSIELESLETAEPVDRSQTARPLAATALPVEPQTTHEAEAPAEHHHVRFEDSVNVSDPHPQQDSSKVAPQQTIEGPLIDNVNTDGRQTSSFKAVPTTGLLEAHLSRSSSDTIGSKPIPPMAITAFPSDQPVRPALSQPATEPGSPSYRYSPKPNAQDEQDPLPVPSAHPVDDTILTQNDAGIEHTRPTVAQSDITHASTIPQVVTIDLDVIPPTSPVTANIGDDVGADRTQEHQQMNLDRNLPNSEAPAAVELAMAAPMPSIVRFSSISKEEVNYHLKRNDREFLSDDGSENHRILAGGAQIHNDIPFSPSESLPSPVYLDETDLLRTPEDDSSS